MRAHGLAEQLRPLFNRATVAEGGMAVPGETQVPILPDLDLAVPPRQRVAGEQTFEVTKERLLPRRRMIGQIIGERGVIDFRPEGARLDERLDLRREIERAVTVQRVIKRLDSQPVARQQKFAPRRIPDGEGEHPTQAFYGARA